jgi:hypothetical protein
MSLPMPKQPAIPSLRYAIKSKVTRREMFLMEINAIVPWVRLIGFIKRHDPKAGL